MGEIHSGTAADLMCRQGKIVLRNHVPSFLNSRYWPFFLAFTLKEPLLPFFFALLHVEEIIHESHRHGKIKTCFNRMVNYSGMKLGRRFKLDLVHVSVD